MFHRWAFFSSIDKIFCRVFFAHYFERKLHFSNDLNQFKLGKKMNLKWIQIGKQIAIYKIRCTIFKTYVLEALMRSSIVLGRCQINQRFSENLSKISCIKFGNFIRNLFWIWLWKIKYLSDQPNPELFYHRCFQYCDQLRSQEEFQRCFHDLRYKILSIEFIWIAMNWMNFMLSSINLWKLPRFAAKCNGLTPLFCIAFTLAPFSNNVSKIFSRSKLENYFNYIIDRNFFDKISKNYYWSLTDEH